MPIKYSRGASKKVESVMKEMKEGKLKSGKDGKGGKVTSRKQAIAIGLSDARKKGEKVPVKKTAAKRKPARKSVQSRSSIRANKK